MLKEGSQAVAKLKQCNPSLVVINAATLRSTGIRICLSVRKWDPKVPIILILEKEKAVDKELAYAFLGLPFTFKKIFNRI